MAQNDVFFLWHCQILFPFQVQAQSAAALQSCISFFFPLKKCHTVFCSEMGKSILEGMYRLQTELKSQGRMDTCMNCLSSSSDLDFIPSYIYI
jgi:hypothetical protein